jgi:hypothetical protein
LSGLNPYIFPPALSLKSQFPIPQNTVHTNFHNRHIAHLLPIALKDGIDDYDLDQLPISNVGREEVGSYSNSEETMTGSKFASNTVRNKGMTWSIYIHYSSNGDSSG